MNRSQFFKQLVATTLLTSFLVGFLNRIPIFQEHQLLSWLSVLLFVAISLAMYVIAQKVAKHQDKSRFISLMYAFMGSKMLLSIMLIFTYHALLQPTDKRFILPFFLVYLIFTIYESYFLIKISKT